MENNLPYPLIITCVVIYALFAFLMLYLKKKLKNASTLKVAVLIPVFGGFILGATILLYAISSL